MRKSGTGATSGEDDTIYEAGARIAVLLPLPLAGPYDYKVPDGLTVARGDIVAVPLGTRVRRGLFGVRQSVT